MSRVPDRTVRVNVPENRLPKGHTPRPGPSRSWNPPEVPRGPFRAWCTVYCPHKLSLRTKRDQTLASPALHLGLARSSQGARQRSRTTVKGRESGFRFAPSDNPAPLKSSSLLGLPRLLTALCRVDVKKRLEDSRRSFSEGAILGRSKDLRACHPTFPVTHPKWLGQREAGRPFR